jgi:hypothetical protein
MRDLCSLNNRRRGGHGAVYGLHAVGAPRRLARALRVPAGLLSRSGTSAALSRSRWLFLRVFSVLCARCRLDVPSVLIRAA